MPNVANHLWKSGLEKVQFIFYEIRYGENEKIMINELNEENYFGINSILNIASRFLFSPSMQQMRNSIKNFLGNNDVVKLSISKCQCCKKLFEKILTRIKERCYFDVYDKIFVKLMVNYSQFMVMHMISHT